MEKVTDKVPDKVAQPERASKVTDEVAQHQRAIKKLEQEINRYQAIPKSSTGETHNLGNAPTPPPLEPTVNEPGYIVFQNPPDPAASVASKPPESKVIAPA
jgi:hypothetical protein